jgi:divalent metal cation (Fe/Co/Zn/Cd) transporter
MASTAMALPNLASEAASRQVLSLQTLTIGWMSVEATIALVAAWTASSPSLVAFGGDSVIELLSAGVVLYRFREGSRLSEKRAARIAGGLLFTLAGLVVLTAMLAIAGVREPRPTVVGVVLLLAAALIMPWLAHRKRRLAALLASDALRADAAESALCGYMAWIALAGLTSNVIWGKPWADSVAALVLIPLIVREGWQAVRSSKVGCGCCA